MNSKERKVENRLKRHQERQELEREYERAIEGEEFDDLPKWEKRHQYKMAHNHFPQKKI